MSGKTSPGLAVIGLLATIAFWLPLVLLWVWHGVAAGALGTTAAVSLIIGVAVKQVQDEVAD